MVEACVGTKTDLRRVGTRWVGLCPFHDERTPSFSVDAERKLYHCFGCQKGGDAIGFLQEVEGLDFPESVEAAGRALQRASSSARTTTRRPSRRRQQRDRLLSLLDRTARFYAALPGDLGRGGEGARSTWRAAASPARC